MLFRSLGKAIQKNGKIVTNTEERIYNQLQENFNTVQEEDVPSGWIYVLKSRSEKPEIKSLENLYKIGFSKNPVQERIKNASKEATYLFADVEIIDSRACFNVNIQKLERSEERRVGKECRS